MLMITGTDKKQSKIIVNTNQAFQVMIPHINLSPKYNFKQWPAGIAMAG